MKRNILRRVAIVAATLGLAGFASVALANHSWNDFHWARTSNPFTLKVGDNVSGDWDQHLNTAIADWSQSSVVDLVKVAGGTRPKTCRPTAGRMEVCNARYGNNGWLGIAQVWASGRHITQGVVKLNDYYFSQSYYNNVGWKSLVTCQEPGHILGLGHQDEDFNNPPITPHTCMDYFVPSPTEVVHPNQHDYDQLASIYGHLDATTTVGQSVTNGNHTVDVDEAREWGSEVRSAAGSGKTSLYVRDLGLGRKVFTHVIWAE